MRFGVPFSDMSVQKGTYESGCTSFAFCPRDMDDIQATEIAVLEGACSIRVPEESITYRMPYSLEPFVHAQQAGRSLAWTCRGHHPHQGVLEKPHF